MTSIIFASLKQNNVIHSSVFSFPLFDLSFLMIDCSHTLDLGCTQDILGNIFHEYLNSTSCVGRTKANRLTNLWQKMKEYYKERKPPFRVNAITQDMVTRHNKHLKFKAKGAETRHLVPFGLMLADELRAASPGYRHMKMVYGVINHLYAFYMQLGNPEFEPDVAGAHARQCCILYGELF